MSFSEVPERCVREPERAQVSRAKREPRRSPLNNVHDLQSLGRPFAQRSLTALWSIRYDIGHTRAILVHVCYLVHRTFFVSAPTRLAASPPAVWLPV